MRRRRPKRENNNFSIKHCNKVSFFISSYKDRSVELSDLSVEKMQHESCILNQDSSWEESFRFHTICFMQDNSCPGCWHQPLAPDRISASRGKESIDTLHQMQRRRWHSWIMCPFRKGLMQWHIRNIGLFYHDEARRHGSMPLIQWLVRGEEPNPRHHPVLTPNDPDDVLNRCRWWACLAVKLLSSPLLPTFPTNSCFLFISI